MWIYLNLGYSQHSSDINYDIVGDWKHEALENEGR